MSLLDVARTRFLPGWIGRDLALFGRAAARPRASVAWWWTWPLVAALPAGLYAATLAPGLTWAHFGQDGGDLISAVQTGGVPHPTGYPTYLLLGRLFARLPFGNVAYRLNLMSAVFAVATVVLVYATVRHLLAQLNGEGWRPAVSGWLAAWALAFSPLFWSQALIAEVYTLNAFFIAAGCYLVVCWTQSRQGNWTWRLIGLGLVTGLALGNHLTSGLLLGPAVVYAVVKTTSDSPSNKALNWQDWLAAGWPALTGLAAGLAVYLYLPWAAHHHPAVNWGAADTWQGFWWLVSGAAYHHYLFGVEWARIPARVSAAAGTSLTQFGPLGIGLIVLGGAYLWQRRRGLGGLVIGVSLLFFVFAIGYDSVDAQVYLLPACVLSAVMLGVGTGWLFQEVAGRRRWLVTALSLAGILCLLATAYLHYPQLDLSGDTVAPDWGAETLEQLPPQALIVSRQDSSTFALWYLQLVEGKRPDVVVADRDLLTYPWYVQMLVEQHPGLVVTGGDVTALTEANPERTVFWLADDGIR